MPSDEEPVDDRLGRDGSAIPVEGTRTPDPAYAAASPEEPARRIRLRRALSTRRAKRIAEWVVLIALALSVAFVLRTFVVQSFFIPSTSMAPTLEVGDRVLVNKLAYRFGEPRRGDVVVFKAPPGEAEGGVKDLIKRIVGLPGETIEGRDGSVYINGEPLEERWLPPGARSRAFGPERIPDDEFWVMGDNRFDSRDSTFFKSIDGDLLVGRAFVRIWPPDKLGGI